MSACPAPPDPQTAGRVIALARWPRMVHGMHSQGIPKRVKGVVQGNPATGPSRQFAEG
jgi:hypothetical protein